MPIFIKENNELNKKSYKIPKNLQRHLQDTLAKYGQYKKSDGYKRLNSLVNPSYNKRNNKQNNGDREISYTDLKRIDFDMRHMSQNPNNLTRILNGGDEMANFVRNTLNHERNKVEPTLKKEKVKTRNKNTTKPTVAPTKTINLGNNKIRIHEDVSSSHIYYDYIHDYGVYYVFSLFEENKNPWNPLILPEMYEKALHEFMKFGKLIHFPNKYIYQWMGIIMKNTAILRAITEICGHTQWSPIDEFVDFYFEADYDLWEKYKQEIHTNSDYDAMSEFLYEKGFDEWSVLPDGSDAISDYGLEPLEKIISQYNENLEPEKVLVIINKCLDVVHCRGDLASIFIQGGSKVLSQISESTKKNKNIYITEKQLKILKKYL